jgi:hypothetical protein
MITTVEYENIAAPPTFISGFTTAIGGYGAISAHLAWLLTAGWAFWLALRGEPVYVWLLAGGAVVVSVALALYFVWYFHRHSET